MSAKKAFEEMIMANVVKRISTKKGGKAAWQITVDLGGVRDDGTRNRRYRTIRSNELNSKTPDAQENEVRKIAEAWEEELKGKKVPQGKRPDKVLFKDCFPGYKEYIYRLLEAGELRRRGADDYIILAERYCLPYFAEKTIESIDTAAAEDYFRYLRDVKKLSPSSRRKVLSVIRKIYKYLIEDVRLISENPFASIKITDRSNKKKNSGAWTDEQTKLFIDIISSSKEYYYGERTRIDSKGVPYTVSGYTRTISVSSKWKAYFFLAITCGMRPGELRALSWKNIDLTSSKVTIESAISDTSEGSVVDVPKSYSGYRILTMAAIAVDALKTWREEQENTAKNLGDQWEGKPLSDFDEQLVFCSVRGGLMDVGTPNKKFQKVVRQWNNSVKETIRRESDPAVKRELKKQILPVLRGYDMRHTCGTLDIEAGTPPDIVAKKMGHASPTTTFNNYIHGNDKVAENSPNQFDSIIGTSAPESVEEFTLQRSEAYRSSVSDLMNDMTLEQLAELKKAAEELKNRKK